MTAHDYHPIKDRDGLIVIGCSCGDTLGRTRDKEIAQLAHRAHVATVIPPTWFAVVRSGVGWSVLSSVLFTEAEHAVEFATKLHGGKAYQLVEVT